MSVSDSRKILEDLNLKKQKLLKGLTGSLTPISSQPAVQPIHEQPVSSVARASALILSQAQSSSFGYFIPQDSQFGNTILPVLPRFD